MEKMKNYITAPVTMTCKTCGRTLDIAHFSSIKGRYRRHMCNHCRWVNVILPSRKRKILINSMKHQEEICSDNYEDMF